MASIRSVPSALPKRTPLLLALYPLLLALYFYSDLTACKNDVLYSNLNKSNETER